MVVPLSVLDLVPVASGQTPADAVRNSIDLAQHAERLGYHRYWFAEHHLNPGVAGTDPAIHIAVINKLFESGATIVNIHSGQPDQKKVIEFYASSVLPKLGTRS